MDGSARAGTATSMQRTQDLRPPKLRMEARRGLASHYEATLLDTGGLLMEGPVARPYQRVLLDPHHAATCASMAGDILW